MMFLMKEITGVVEEFVYERVREGDRFDYSCERFYVFVCF